MFRDSGLQGDAICEQIFREAPAHLAEGGFAQVICNWVRIAGQDWLSGSLGWFADSGCDVWIIHWTYAGARRLRPDWLTQSDRSPTPERFAERIRAVDGLLRPAPDRGDRFRDHQPSAADGGTQLDAGRHRIATPTIAAVRASWSASPRTT